MAHLVLILPASPATRLLKWTFPSAQFQTPSSQGELSGLLRCLLLTGHLGDEPLPEQRSRERGRHGWVWRASGVGSGRPAAGLTLCVGRRTVPQGSGLRSDHGPCTSQLRSAEESHLRLVWEPAGHSRWPLLPTQRPDHRDSAGCQWCQWADRPACPGISGWRLCRKPASLYGEEQRERDRHQPHDHTRLPCPPKPTPCNLSPVVMAVGGGAFGR